MFRVQVLHRVSVWLMVGLLKEFTGLRNMMDLEMFEAFFKRVDADASRSGVCQR